MRSVYFCFGERGADEFGLAALPDDGGRDVRPVGVGLPFGAVTRFDVAPPAAGFSACLDGQDEDAYAAVRRAGWSRDDALRLSVDGRRSCIMQVRTDPRIDRL